MQEFDIILIMIIAMVAGLIGLCFLFDAGGGE